LTYAQQKESKLACVHVSHKPWFVCSFVAYINLSQHGEANTIVQLAKLLNLVVGAWVLASELIARETDDFKVVGVFGFDVFVELLEALELGGEAAFRGCVYDEDDFAVELGEVVGGALFCVGLLVAAREYGRELGEREWEERCDVLSLGLKSKKLVAEAMVE